jgi:hypothetical protein
MMSSNNDNKKPDKSYRYWLRVIHRDIGFLMVGVCFVYAISGILLNHMDGKDPSFKTEEYSLQFTKELSAGEVKILWEDKKDLPRLNKVVPIDDTHYRLLFSGGTGVYDSTSGIADYEKYSKRHFVFWINKLHYNKVKGWSIMGDFFAVSLIFFAVSGLFMVKGKKGIAGSGKYYLIAGLLIPVIYIIIG